MQIAIDISKEDYEWIKQASTRITYYYPSTLRIYKAIANGTLLPKGHGALKDADVIISEICGSSCGCHLEECGHDKPCFSVTKIESARTIINADKD